MDAFGLIFVVAFYFVRRKDILHLQSNDVGTAVCTKTFSLNSPTLYESRWKKVAKAAAAAELKRILYITNYSIILQVREQTLETIIF
jgi:hypothetical protein